MKTARDTSLDAHAVQMRLLRKATPARRCHLALSLSDTTRHLARRGLDRAYPELPEHDRDLLFVRMHYGKKLADGVKRHMQKHDAAR